MAQLCHTIKEIDYGLQYYSNNLWLQSETWQLVVKCN